MVNQWGLSTGTPFIVFSYGKKITNNKHEITYHGLNRGSKAVNLIDSINENIVELNETDLDSLEKVEFRVNVN